jgi:hypothetical protein
MADQTLDQYTATITPVVRNALKLKAGAFGWFAILTFVVRWLPTIIAMVVQVMALTGNASPQLKPETCDPEVLAAWNQAQGETA